MAGLGKTRPGYGSRGGRRKRTPLPLDPGLLHILGQVAPGGHLQKAGPIRPDFEPSLPDNPFTPHVRPSAATRAAWYDTVAPPPLQAPGTIIQPTLGITGPTFGSGAYGQRPATQTLAEAKQYALAGEPQLISTDPVYGVKGLGARGPALYEALMKAAYEPIEAKEGVKEDPLAELGINLLATAGVGGLASLATRGGAEVVSGAAGTAFGGAAESAAPRTISDLLRDAAGSVRAAPGAAREAVTTAAGRRAAAKGAAEFGAGQALKHPKLSQQGALGLTGAVTGQQAGGLGIPKALLEGQWNAFTNDPGKVLETTGRGLVGAVTAPAALLYSGAESALTGDPNPFLNTAGGLGEGIEHMAGEALSGDPARVQKATEDELGLFWLPLLPRGLSGPLAHSLRDAARTGKQGLRDFGTRNTPFDFRHGPDENYVFPRLQRRAERGRVAKQAQNETLPERLRAHHHATALETEARDLPQPRSLGNVHGFEGGSAMSTLAEFGIRDPAQMALLDKLPQSRRGRQEEDVTIGTVIDAVKRDPSLITDPSVASFLDRYRENVGTLPLSQQGANLRATYLPLAGIFDELPPERMTPHGALAYTDQVERRGAWDDLRAQEATGQTLRTSARQKLAEYHAEPKIHDDAGNLVESPKAKGLKTEAQDLYARAKRTEKNAKGLRKALSPYSRPEHAVSTRARRKLWDQPLLDDFVQRVRTKMADPAAHLGERPGSIPPLADPIWTHHGEFPKRGARVGSKRGGGVPNRAEHIRHALDDPESLLARDLVDRSLSALISGSAELPRVTHGGKKLTRAFYAKEHQRIKVENAEGERVTKSRVTEDEYQAAIDEGQLDPKSYIWVPESEYKQSYLARDVEAGELADPNLAKTRSEILADAQRSRVAPKGLIVRKEAQKEFEAQGNPQRWFGETVVNFASKGAGRVLLFSPAWVQLQAIAEGIPILMDHPYRTLNPVKATQIALRVRRYNKLNKEEALGYAATMGEAPGRIATARELQPNFSATHSHFYDTARAIEHNPIGRAMFSLARLRPFVLFDQWRQGKYQQFLAAAEIDRQFNGFLSGLQGAVRGESKLSAELRKMSPDEQLRAINTPRYRSELDKIQGHVQAILGNWTAFTRFERAFAPFAVFYGFMRYALRWPLTFAKEHPITATIDYLAAQANAEQLEKLLGKAPASFREFANPVVQNAEGERSELPSGVRISPGLSPFAQGALEGNAPAAAVGSTNPFLLGTPIGLFTGIDSFGGYDEDTGWLGLHWGLAKKQLISTPPVFRLFGIGQSESDTAKELRAIDPNRALRSFGLPFGKLSEESARASNDIITGLKEYEEGEGESGESSSNPFLGGSSSSSSNPFLPGSSGSSSSNPFLP